MIRDHSLALRRSVFIRSLQIKAEEIAHQVYMRAHNGTVAIWFNGTDFIVKLKKSETYRILMDKHPEKLVGVYTAKAQEKNILDDLLCTIDQNKQQM